MNKKLLDGKIKKILGIMIICTLMTASLTACSITKKQDKQESSKKTLNIGIQPAVGFLPLYIMRDNKLLEKKFKDAGYDIKITYTEYESGPPENEAFAAGAADIGVMGNVPALSGIASGQDRKLIGIAYNGEATEAIIVSKESGIKSVSDLKGKKIGLVVGSIAQNLVYAVFKNNGLKFNDVEFVNLSAGEQGQALANGQVDAIAAWEPTISKLTADGSNVILADGKGVFLGENPIVARGRYVKDNPRIVEIFLDEYKKAAKLLNGDIDTYAKKYSDYFGIEESVISSALANAAEPIMITDEDVKDLQKTEEFLRTEKLISTEINVKEHVDYSFSKKLK